MVETRVDDEAMGDTLDLPKSNQSPIRVMVIRSVSGAGGGADKIILRTAEHADQSRLQMTLCVIHGHDDAAFDMPSRAAKLGVKLIAVPQRWPCDPRVLRVLRATASEGSFDVIHSHDYKANYYARKLAGEHKLPIVSTAHGWTGNLLRERGFYYPIDKHLLRDFDAVIGVSSEICEELATRGVPRQRLRTILNCVDAAKYRRDEATRVAVRKELSIADDEIVIGAVGRIEKQKRFDLLIEAFARLAAQRKSLRLLIAGEGALLTSLEALVRRLQIEDRCQLLGHCRDMCRLYQAFDMYVQSSEYEGTPTVLVESMAMAIPIVATDVGGTTELVYPDRHGLIVPPHDAGALANAIQAVLDDPVAAAERVGNARRRAERDLSIERRTEQLMDVYSRVLNETHTFSSEY